MGLLCRAFIPRRTGYQPYPVVNHSVLSVSTMAGRTGWSPDAPLLNEDSLISLLSSGGRSPEQKRVRREGHALAVVSAPYSSSSGLVPPIGDVIGGWNVRWLCIR